MDVEITIEFLTGGGAYLPGLDDNFVADRVVTFPMVSATREPSIKCHCSLHFQVHIVHFDTSQKIQQVRLYWDQGSLLKSVDVIGARARNWPIRDGKDQVRLVASSAAAATQGDGFSRPSTMSSGSEASRDSKDVVITNKPRSQSKNVTRDPHASLSLFAPHDDLEESSQSVAPRAPKSQSAKPPPRDYHDLFVGNDSDASPQPPRLSAASPTKENGAPRAPKAQSAKPPPRDYHDLFVGNESDASPASKGKVASPQKENMTPAPIAPKAGAGKNFKPSRLFDTEASADIHGSPDKSLEKLYKSNPQKYNHFEFGEPKEASQPVVSRPKSKHQNNWDFEDFMTPEKVPTKVRGQDVRHFGWSDDEPVMDSPIKHPAVAKSRPDANTNFEFQDDGTPAGERRPPGHPRGMGNVKGPGLYQNNVFDERTSTSPEKKGHPLATVTNLKDRRKDFDPHFSMTDESPSSQHKPPSVSESRAKVVNQMGAQWESSDFSPGPHSRGNDNANRINPVISDKENVQNGGGNKRNMGIKTGGDGMGGKRGADRSWGFGDESDDNVHDGVNGGKFRASRTQQTPKDGGFWDL